MKEVTPIYVHFPTDFIDKFNKMYQLKKQRNKIFIKADKYYLSLIQVKKILDLLTELNKQAFDVFTIYEYKDLHIIIQNNTETKILILPLKN